MYSDSTKNRTGAYGEFQVIVTLGKDEGVLAV